MNVAQILPNWSAFDSEKAIGIKAVVRDVTLGLKARGHTVTVFAPDKSVFPRVLLRFSGPSLKESGRSLFDRESVALQHAYAEKIVPELGQFDIVHSHIEHVLLPYIHAVRPPVVSTTHGANFAMREQKVFERFPHEFFIALSEGAKRALPYIHFSSVVYNGIDALNVPFVFHPQKPSYVAWMGRFSENKGAIDAIMTAKKTGDVLTLVGFEEKGQEAYLKRINAEVDGAMIRLLDRMIGPLKYDFLGNAKAFLFPIHWEEPFGLVMIEAMACGTPVIAYNRGSVSEIVKDGVTGFIVEPNDNTTNTTNQTNTTNTTNKDGKWVIKKRGVEGLVEAVKRIGEIDRAACRRHVEENFTVEKMVEGYEKVYQKVLKT
ncbi:MAG: glycosyltransferase family 4 protein [Candidatus Gottesmanbacteria bacterium]|nr:glycosyltransferase family 4 protein [Candidatus Gottesmanbacteria bacterium]